jgi:hypothetical protein
MFRLFASPMIVVGMGMSRVFARFPRAKRLTVYGLLIEVVTMICLMAAMAL